MPACVQARTTRFRGRVLDSNDDRQSTYDNDAAGALTPAPTFRAADRSSSRIAGSRRLTRDRHRRSCQSRNDHVVGNFREVIEELTDREKVLRCVQTDDLVGLTLYARE